jgi:hypothetical protein
VPTLRKASGHRDGVTGIQDALCPGATGRGPYAQGATILFSGEAAGDSCLADCRDRQDTGSLTIPASGAVQDWHAYDCLATYVVAKMAQHSGGSDVPDQLCDEAEVEIYSTLISGGPFGWQPVAAQYPYSFDNSHVTFTSPDATGASHLTTTIGILATGRFTCRIPRGTP